MVLNIFQMIATRVFLTALECTKTFSTGTPPRTLLGKLTALPRLPRWFKGPREGEGRKRKKERGRGTLLGAEGTGPLTQILRNAPVCLTVDAWRF